MQTNIFRVFFYKLSLSIFFFIALSLPQKGSSTELSILAKENVDNILNKRQIEPEFHTLSPDLLLGISKSFVILNECLPDLLSQGSYFEFGLYRGFSLWFAQQVGRSFTNNEFHFYGFDSFCGLPDKSNDYIGGAWAPGVYSASLAQVTQLLDHHGADFSRLHLIQGWYSHQLFSNYNNLFSSSIPAIITIDSDTYESCNEVLAYTSQFFKPGTILLFDDFIVDLNTNLYGERRSIIEFLSAHPDFKLMHLFPFGGHGYAFMVIACRDMFLDEESIEHVHELIGTPKLPTNFEAVPIVNNNLSK